MHNALKDAEKAKTLHLKTHELYDNIINDTSPNQSGALDKQIKS
jgi:hypothetical protein